jgi:hypothetical protein
MIENCELRVNNILDGNDTMSITTIKKEINRKLVIAVLLPLLTSCATYSSSFSCGDARGANCTSMDKVDAMIDSGEIERFDEGKNACRGRKCKTPSINQGDGVLEQTTEGGASIHHFNEGGS